MTNLDEYELLEHLEKKLSISNFNHFMKVFVELANEDFLISENWNGIVQFYVWAKKTGKPPKGKPILSFWLKFEKTILDYIQGEVKSSDLELKIAESNFIKIFKGQLDITTAALENKVDCIGSFNLLFELQMIIDSVFIALESYIEEEKYRPQDF